MEKNDREALDRFLGEAFVGRFEDWKCVRQFKPRGLKFFDFVVLAHVVHVEAPIYTALKDGMLPRFSMPLKHTVVWSLQPPVTILGGKPDTSSTQI